MEMCLEPAAPSPEIDGGHPFSSQQTLTIWLCGLERRGGSRTPPREAATVITVSQWSSVQILDRVTVGDAPKVVRVKQGPESAFSRAVVTLNGR